jgi:hypothetical protein
MLKRLVLEADAEPASVVQTKDEAVVVVGAVADIAVVLDEGEPLENLADIQDKRNMSAIKCKLYVIKSHSHIIAKLCRYRQIHTPPTAFSIERQTPRIQLQ